jgi:hypothetical protein
VQTHYEGRKGLKDLGGRAAISEKTRPEETTTGKHGKCYQDPQEDPRAGIHEVSKWDVQWATKNDGPDTVDGSTPSEMEKETADMAGASNVEALAATTRGGGELWINLD